MSNRNTFRHGDTMIAVESTPAVVAFDDLLAATRVIEDTDNCEAPWENWDGWEHTAKPARPSTMPTSAKGKATAGHGTVASLRIHVARG